MQLKEMEGRDDIGVSCTAVDLTTTELSSNDRLFAIVGIFGEMVFHAGLDAAAAGLDARAGLLNVRLASLDDRDAAEQSRFASL